MGGVEKGSIQEPASVQSKPLTREELAKRFFYEDIIKIPPGVDPKQLDFLRDAATIGCCLIGVNQILLR